MKRTGFTVYIYNISVDYDDIADDNIKDIQKYLMKKNNIVWYVHMKMFGFIKKYFQ